MPIPSPSSCYNIRMPVALLYAFDCIHWENWLKPLCTANKPTLWALMGQLCWQCCAWPVLNMISMLCAEYNYRQSIIQNYYNLLSSAPVPPLFSSLFVRIPNRFCYQNLSIWWNNKLVCPLYFILFFSLCFRLLFWAVFLFLFTNIHIQFSGTIQGSNIVAI